MTDHREIEQLVETVRRALNTLYYYTVEPKKNPGRTSVRESGLDALRRLATIAKTAEERVRALTARNQFLSTEQIRADLAEERVRALERELQNEQVNATRAKAAEAALATEREAREDAEREHVRLAEALDELRAEVLTERKARERAEAQLRDIRRQMEKARSLDTGRLAVRVDRAEARAERAEEALREILDLCAGWCRPMADDDRKELIERTATAALSESEGVDQVGAEDPAKLKEAREASDSR